MTKTFRDQPPSPETGEGWDGGNRTIDDFRILVFPARRETVGQLQRPRNCDNEP